MAVSRIKLHGGYMMKIKNFILALVSVVLCFSFSSCRQVTDMSEHKAEFYVLNLTNSPLTVEFISEKPKSVFNKCSINNIQPTEESASILSESFQDIIKLQAEEVGYVCSKFVPGTYLIDIDNFSESENIYPIVFKDEEKINIKNGKAACMVLRYNSNPRSFFIIIKSKLKLRINASDYNSILNDPEYKNALEAIYFKGTKPERDAVIRSDLIISTPKESIEKIRCLEKNPLLVEDNCSYFIFEPYQWLL
jgi:lipoprotein